MKKKSSIFPIIALLFSVVCDVGARVRTASSDKEALLEELDAQQLLSVAEGWSDKASDLLLDLFVSDRQAAHNYLKKIYEKSAGDLEELRVIKEKLVEAPLPLTESQQEALKRAESIGRINKVEIIKKLDELLSKPITTERHQVVEDLLFDLSMVDRAKASEYSKKIYAAVERDVPKMVLQGPSKQEEITPVVEPIDGITKSIHPSVSDKKEEHPTAPGTSMKKGTPPVAPGKKEDISVAPSTGMKKGAPPAAPKPGQGKPGGIKKPAANDEKNVVVTLPKVSEQIFSVSKLKELDKEKLLELFGDLLNKLPNNWNGQAVERVEEMTKHGSKVYNVYGVPIPKWTNDIATLKKVIISKNIKTEEEITKEIMSRIAEVRAQKNVKAAVPQSPEEKPKEELTKEDIIKLIKILFADPKVTEIGWNVSVKKNIKELDKIDHEAALGYHDEYITLSKEKAFLKK